MGNPIDKSFACIECEDAVARSDEDACCATCGGDLFVTYGPLAERRRQLRQITNIVACRERAAVEIEREACAKECEAVVASEIKDECIGGYDAWASCCVSRIRARSVKP